VVFVSFVYRSWRHLGNINPPRSLRSGRLLPDVGSDACAAALDRSGAGGRGSWKPAGFLNKTKQEKMPLHFQHNLFLRGQCVTMATNEAVSRVTCSWVKLWLWLGHFSVYMHGRGIQLLTEVFWSSNAVNWLRKPSIHPAASNVLCGRSWYM